MLNFFRLQYRLGRLDAMGLAQYVAARRLTEAQYQQIMGPASPAGEAADE